MRFGVVLAVMTLVASCTVDLVIPAGAELACDGDIDCPGGFVCSTSLFRCVTSDLGAAALSPSIAPEWASAGTIVRVEFTTAGELRSRPVVELQTTPARSCQFLDLTGDRYAFTYTTLGDEPAGAFAVTATLVDPEGNSTTSPLGQVTFDFTPPTGSGSRNGDSFGSGDTLSQSLGVSEALGQHPSVVIASGAPLALALVSHDGTSYGFQYTFDGTELQGAFSVIATLIDRAGNEAAVDLGSITVTHP